LCNQEPVSNFTKQAGSLTTAKENWEEFNYNEVTYAHRGWYENIETTLKKTSATGKGPLWAQVAKSIAYTKTKCGDSMCGFKMKL
jgi:hypothetical protein